ncbi:uncharacterized protein LOC134227939 [Armigeres subalbatus]|uniref:uncharacterized protein LOC134227939 n=1 Tax=Armigeres subalbatus TaxID=124917 RepID=UPI002ED12A49
MVRKYIRKTLSTYSKEALNDAATAVRDHRMSLAESARFYNIPKPTLFRHIKGLSGIKSSSRGRSTAIPFEVEARMASCIKTMEKWGYGLSKKEIIFDMAQFLKKNSIKTPFKDDIPGDDYFLNFKRRHGLSHKKPQSVEVARKRAADPFVISEYFQLLKEVTRNVPPERIYNIDETSFCLDPSRIKVVGAKGRAAHRLTAGPGRENYTVLMGGNAFGDKLGPLIIFRGKNLWDSWMAKEKDEFSGMTYAATENETTFEPAALQRFKDFQQRPASPTISEPNTPEFPPPQVLNESTSGVSKQPEIANQSSFSENSFEAMLLDHVKQDPVLGKSKRRRVCTGAEVITSPEVVDRLIKNEEEKAKKKDRKKKPATQKDKEKKPQENKARKKFNMKKPQKDKVKK